jgi:hypothetical protein
MLKEFAQGRERPSGHTQQDLERGSGLDESWHTVGDQEAFAG